nr:MAG TPA: hypothetical protein [Caudoviricetes sp.]
MLTISKSINVNGYSRVNENDKPYVYFGATIDKNGSTNVNYSVQDKDVFNANQDLFETDRKAFETEVRKLAN